MVVVHSATKGLAAMTLALAHSRGWLDYEERVATYWPEFARQGKEKITVRQLLAPSGRSVRLRRAGRPECGCGSRPIGGGDGSSQAGMGAWHAAGLSRADPRILRRRAVAPRGSAASQPGSVLSGRNRDASWRGHLHPTPRRHPERSLGHTLTSRTNRDAVRVPPPSAHGRGDESPFEHLSRAGHEPGYVGVPGRANECTRAIWRCQPAAASARRAAWRTRTASSPLEDANSGCEKRRWTCWPRRRFLRCEGSTTNASKARCSSRSAS